VDIPWRRGRRHKTGFFLFGNWEEWSISIIFWTFSGNGLALRWNLSLSLSLRLNWGLDWSLNWNLIWVLDLVRIFFGRFWWRRTWW